MSGPLYSIIVPVYRSEKTLRELYERVANVFSDVDGEFELIMVEDCGGDHSWLVMQSLRREDERVRVIRLTRNFGQHNALMCGFSFARGQFVITMDDDLQNPPEEIPKLIGSIVNSDFDVVYGIPEQKRQNAVRKLGSMIYARFNSIIFSNVAKLRISNFRILRKSVVDQIVGAKTPNPIVGHLVLAVTERVGHVTTKQNERAIGRTTYSTSKLVRFFLNGILYNSTLPLRLVSVMGVASLLFCSILAIYYLLLYLSGSIGVSGFTTLVLLMLFFFGVIMLSMGIIGEYLLRIIQEVGGRPQYVIMDKDV